MDSRPSSPEAPPQDLWVLSLTLFRLLQKPPSDDKEDHRTDFAVGYDFANVRDEADEDTLARLSVYTVPSSPGIHFATPAFCAPRTTLPHTLVMIALDWTRPWTFVEELETWLRWVEKWARGDAARELEIHAATLGPGTLTHNSAGVPIIVVCTKADLIDEGSDLAAGASGMGGMVRGKGGEWEERTDSIMQVLRTICLKYGAGLFYAPNTLPRFRPAAIRPAHALPPPAPSPAVASGAEAPAPVRNPFPFTHKPNYLDRDRSSSRGEFEARAWGEAWDRDLDTGADGGPPADGARALFSALVPDQAPPLPPLNNPTPEQAFLAKNYDENAKKPDRDPRGAFRDPTDPRAAAGLVGPLGGMPSFDLPTVDRVLSEMVEIGSGGSAGAGGAPRAPAAATNGLLDSHRARRRLGSRVRLRRGRAKPDSGREPNAA
ncbi:hypothetical protein B0H13DRAFT_2579942 [Mycena leptocephala]|nr:hypothetical protein B0H13DRAFT_2579942 [Mycena leptocephala]